MTVCGYISGQNDLKKKHEVPFYSSKCKQVELMQLWCLSVCTDVWKSPSRSPLQLILTLFHQFFMIFFTIPFSKPFNRAPNVEFMYMWILYKYRTACESKWMVFRVWKWAKNSVKLLWSRYLAPLPNLNVEFLLQVDLEIRIATREASGVSL